MNHTHRVHRGFVLLFCAFAAVAACGDDTGQDVSERSTNTSTSVTTPTTSTSSQTNTSSTATSSGVFAELGEGCDPQTVCRAGLVCEASGQCVPSGAQRLGEPCLVDDECGAGLQCGEQSVCEAQGKGELGGMCASPKDCGGGLVCLRETVVGRCVEQGAAWPGMACNDTSDCAGGLVCHGALGAERVCLPWGESVGRAFKGFPCEERGPERNFRSYFELPKGPVEEFYRLPFPNDILVRAGRISMSAHKTSGGQSDLGVDLVDVLLDAVSQRQDGFGANQATIFRFSAAVDLATLTARGESPTVFMVDLTQGSPTFGRREPISWQAGTGRDPFRCGDWLTVRPAWGRPLTPGHTYGVILTDGVASVGGQPILKESDFDQMLQPDMPAESIEARAWQAYAPLRAWLDASQTDPTTLRNAAVFTVGDLHAVTRNLPTAVQRAEAPHAQSWTLCEGAQTVSPCATSGAVCSANLGEISELHFTLSTPVFQTGTRPYLAQGGAIETDSDDVAVVQGYEDVCASMLVPSEQAPSGGWPVILYAHETGASFHSHADHIGPLLAQMGDDDPTTGAIVVSWDQVLHGTRSGDGSSTAFQRVYNFSNPDALRGNFWQSAADLHTLVRWLESFSLSAQESPTGSPIAIDLDRVYVVGFGQGAHGAALALPFTSRLKHAVLGGFGGSTLLQSLDQRDPVNLTQALETGYQLGEASEEHPVLNILQGWLDPIDPLNALAAWTNGSASLNTAADHLFVALSEGDVWAPRSTQEALVTSARLELAQTDAEPFSVGGVPLVEPPVSGNEEIAGSPYTRVCRSYSAEPNQDPHRIFIESEAARRDLVQFLRSASTDDVPTVLE